VSFWNAVCKLFNTVQFDTTLFNTRFSEVVGLLEDVGFQSMPKLSFEDRRRAQMVCKTVPDDRSGNAETSFAEFRCCTPHGQISTFRRKETDWAMRYSPSEYRRAGRICGTGTSDAAECKECNFKLYSLRYRQPV